MGGGNERQNQPLYPAEKLPIRDLVYRYQDEGDQKNEYSDNYTKRVFEERKKRVDDIMNALARLGILDQLEPKETVYPMVPYRMIEPKISF